MKYDVGHSKQGDASFIPRGLPAPTQANRLRYQPNSQRPYPTFVYECAVSNESRYEMLEDAGEKYFAPATSVQVWLGVKIRFSSVQNGESYWVGWGTRRAVGHG